MRSTTLGGTAESRAVSNVEATTTPKMAKNRVWVSDTDRVNPRKPASSTPITGPITNNSVIGTSTPTPHASNPNPRATRCNAHAPARAPKRAIEQHSHRHRLTARRARNNSPA
jgi:hypothetical protein